MAADGGRRQQGRCTYRDKVEPARRRRAKLPMLSYGTAAVDYRGRSGVAQRIKRDGRGEGIPGESGQEPRDFRGRKLVGHRRAAEQGNSLQGVKRKFCHGILGWCSYLKAGDRLRRRRQRRGGGLDRIALVCKLAGSRRLGQRCTNTGRHEQAGLRYNARLVNATRTPHATALLRPPVL